MVEIVVTAESRTETGTNANRRLRRSGRIPGILYGPQKQTVALTVSPKEVGAVLHSPAGTSTLFDLEYQGTRHKVLLKEYQADPIRGNVLHADFLEVALDKPIHVRVHIELEGAATAAGIKAGGILDFITREIDVECLPTQIPEKITADVSALELGQHLRVSELPTLENVRVLTDEDVVVAHIVVKREEAAATPAEGEPVAAATAEPEVAKKGKPGEGEDKK